MEFVKEIVRCIQVVRSENKLPKQKILEGSHLNSSV